MKQSSHKLDSVGIRFDAAGMVANAGLILPATLGERLGVGGLIDEHVHLGKVAGAANPGQKAMTMVASLLAGGDHIDDVNALRSGGTAAVLGLQPAAASTVGTFLRAFSSGHARQLDAVIDDMFQRAWDLGARPCDELVKVDLDASLIETFGLQKQGGIKFSYQHTRGYHPLFAVIAGSGELLHARLRGGNANSGRGAASFTRQALSRLRRASRSQEVVVRADSGFYSGKVVKACEDHDARFSISVRLHRTHHELIEKIPESAWKEIPYWQEGSAAVAETTYIPFGGKRSYRFIVRRVEPTPGSQLALRGLNYSYFAFITNREGETLELEADHRQHAEIELVIRDLKYGLGLNHMPSGKFGANAAWLALNVIAHNLCRWLGRLGGLAVLHLKTLRHRLFSLPARLVRSGRRSWLRFPADWPWEVEFSATLARLRALSP